MDVHLKAIAFNHNLDSATTDAFSIRRNETRPIDLPEWQPGCLIPEESQAAYARAATADQTITIKARFSCCDPSVTLIEVQAVDGSPPLTLGSVGGSGGLLPAVNVLGKVKATPVPLNAGESVFVSFDLEDVLIADAGISKSDVVWHWEFRLSDCDSWTEFARTRHRIYTVLALPTDPWKPLSPNIQNTQLPWTEVLDVACDWAAGKQDIVTATTETTRNINSLGDPNLAGVRRAKYSEDPSYALEGTNNFDCTAFLDRVKGGPGNGAYVNCFDCAAAVSSFSNILGANLWQSKMGYNFVLNHLLRIGEEEEDGGDFYQHEVAWTGNATKDDRIFDACLKLDGDSSPGPEEPEHFAPLLPINIPFGDLADEQYRFRIDADIGGSPCEAFPVTKRRRFIGVTHLKKSTHTRKELKILSEHYEFQDWKNTQHSKQNLFVWRFFLSGSEVPGWKAGRIRSFKTIGRMPATRRAFWSQESSSEVLLRVYTFECTSIAAARSFLLDVLGESQLLNLKRLRLPAIEKKYNDAVGDVAFTDPENMAIFFARANIVVSIRNAGPNSLLVGEFAQTLDTELRSRPDREGKAIQEMEHFRFPDKEFRVGDQVPIAFLRNQTDVQQLLYKFFAASGELSLKSRQIFYTPTSSGAQEVLVFGVDAEQNARRQRLKIVIAD